MDKLDLERTRDAIFDILRRHWMGDQSRPTAVEEIIGLFAAALPVEEKARGVHRIARDQKFIIWMANTTNGGRNGQAGT